MNGRPEEIIRGLTEAGPRVAGTEKGVRAIGRISAYLRDLGFRTERQEFDCPLWSIHEGPALQMGGVDLECAPMIGSASGHARGRLVRHGRMLIWGDRSWPCYRVVGERGESLAYVLVRPDGPAAPQPLPPGASGVPHVAVGASEEPEIEEAADLGIAVSLELRASTRPARGCNVRAWIGEDALDRGGTILVTAHVDTVPGTPGAYDNAGGVAALLEVGEQVAGGELPSRVQVLLTDAEELHLAGSRSFVGRLAEEGRLENVAGCLNLDGAGRGEVLDVWLAPASLAEHVLPLVDGSRSRFTFPPPESGDHTAFAERGIPVMMLTYDDPEIIHRAEDKYEASKLNNALRMARSATAILRRLTNEGVW